MRQFKARNTLDTAILPKIAGAHLQSSVAAVNVTDISVSTLLM
jgi:hypothetical protein